MSRLDLAPRVTIPAEAWDRPDDDPNVMVTSIFVNGVMLHVTAFRVVDHDAEGGAQNCPGHNEDLGLLWHVHGMDGHADTVTIGGGEWLLFAEPGGA